MAKVQANLEALRTLQLLQEEQRPARPPEQVILAKWASWGAIPEVFDETNARFAGVRTELATRLSDREFAAARRTTINAHYTSAEVVQAVWSTVEQLGFSGGRVLEPGCGSGNFIGFAPPGCVVTGIELDPVTANIAAALYPRAMIQAESFADTSLGGGSFDLVIGNVPFGKIVLHDPAHNRGGHSIHNHFILKGLDLTRPGGMVAVVTSRFTLDAAADAARREMADKADFLGAIRLPAGTFRAAAGTDVVTDIVVLRKREPGAERGGEPWLSVAPIATVDGEVPINEYFVAHPEMICGTLRRVNGQYRADDLDVRADPEKTLGPAIAAIVAQAEATSLTYQPLPEQAADSPTPQAPASAPGPLAVQRAPGASEFQVRKEGSIVTTGIATFARVRAGELEPFQPKAKTQAQELRALCGLRDTMAEVLALQVRSTDNGVFADAQARLNQRYDDYGARYGPISRFTAFETGRLDADTGEPATGRRHPPMGGFRADPDFPSLLALEIFDSETQAATKAPIFSERVVGPREVPVHAGSPAEAVAICLDQAGAVTLDRVAALLNIDPSATRSALATLVFDDPATDDLVPAARYLSGNVREKLHVAEAAVVDDPRFAPNVTALRGVLPEDLLPTEIDARPGVTWIDTSDVAAFARDVLGATQVAVEHVEVTATWTLSVPSWQKQGLTMTSKWGTDRANAVALLDKCLNQTQHSVYDSDGEGGRVLNGEATLLAREKQQAISDRFATWVWEDPVRSERLATRYNELFNSVVAPAWDGSHQTLPGLSAAFTPRKHQLDAAWRSVQEPTVLLGHAVGAGKTATMVIAAMEMKRLGLVSKPTIVVPNHMLEQFSAELLQTYPLANILVATKELTTRDALKEFVARCATGDWDAVVITHSAFERIPVSKEAELGYREARVVDLRAAQAQSKGEHGLSVKKLEADIIREEEKIKASRDDARRLDGVTFEETGIDYLFLDEAHMAKHLAFASRIQGIGGAGSNRARDIDVKLQVLRDRNGDRVATFATGTFVTNSISELYVMQRFLQPDALKAAGIASFDAWAANFGRVVTALELSPDGGSYRMKDRFARFANVPELMMMFSQVADIKTAEQLALPTPNLVGDRAEVIVVPPSAALTAYVETLVDRAAAVSAHRVRPEEDNMLKVSGDGRKAALDLRLVGLSPDPDGGKITAAASRITQIWEANKDRPYPEAGDRLGALQLVFCDLGTPRAEWNVYDELRAQLVERGLPRESIRFIHEAKSDRAKADLFAQCRSGAVSVLLGSTAKMGVGTNVQARAAALHHLDCPWLPAELEQREGRILRQGNLNSNVEVLRYVTEQSFDVFMWQTVERKAAFIAQVTQPNNHLGREVEDVGEQSLSFAEVKALASGNPLIMEKAGVDSEVAKLSRIAAAHATEQRRLAKTIAAAPAAIERLEHAVARLEAAIEQRIDVAGEAFIATITGVTCNKRTEAGERIKEALADARHSFGATTTIGHLAGFDLAAAVKGDAGETELHLFFPDAPIRPLVIGANEISLEHPAGLVTRLTNRLGDLDERLANDTGELAAVTANVVQAHELAGKPFDQAGRLDRLRSRQIEITAALMPERDTDAAPPEPPGPPADPEAVPDIPSTPPPNAGTTVPAAVEADEREAAKGPAPFLTWFAPRPEHGDPSEPASSSTPSPDQSSVGSPGSDAARAAFPNSVGASLAARRKTVTDRSSAVGRARRSSPARHDLGR